jgi:hypothetical protein
MPWMRARWSPLGSALGLLALLAAGWAAGWAAGCSAPAPRPRTNHDALYRSAAGEGEYEVDPLTAALARRGPARLPPEVPAADTPKPCEHVWQSLDLATHSYIDPQSGLPALCTPIVCPKCGLVRHECQGRHAR